MCCSWFPSLADTWAEGWAGAGDLGSQDTAWPSQPGPACDTAAGDTQGGCGLHIPVGELVNQSWCRPSHPGPFYRSHCHTLHHSLCPFHLRGSLPVPECSAAGQWVPLLVSSRTARPEPPSRRSPGGPGTGEPGPGALLGLGVLGLFPAPQRSGCIPTMLPGAILSRSLPAMGRGALCVTMCDPHLCPETLPKLHVM